MRSSKRTSGVAPYVQQLLYNEDVQQATGRAVSAARDAYVRGRGRGPREVVSDKKLRRRLQQAATAAREAWSTAAEPPRRKRGARLKLVAVSVAAAAAFLAANPTAREKILARLGHKRGEE